MLVVKPPSGPSTYHHLSAPRQNIRAPYTQPTLGVPFAATPIHDLDGEAVARFRIDTVDVASFAGRAHVDPIPSSWLVRLATARVVRYPGGRVAAGGIDLFVRFGGPMPSVFSTSSDGEVFDETQRYASSFDRRVGASTQERLPDPRSGDCV